MNLAQILNELRQHSNPENVKGMARFGIQSSNAFGVSMPFLRGLAKQIKNDSALARELWDSGFHEARILACLVMDPNDATPELLEEWVKDFDSWDVCDQCCLNLFRRTPFAYEKVWEWSAREEEYVKRAGFVLLATLAVHDKKAPNSQFEAFLPLIAREAHDARNFVKKAVNWALREIGKRNDTLNAKVLEFAQELAQRPEASARWIARDAIRDITSEAAQRRMSRRATSR